MARTAPAIAAIALLGAAWLLAAPPARASCALPRLIEDLPRQPVQPRPAPPACLHGFTVDGHGCGSEESRAYRRAVEAYLDGLGRFADQARSYADATAAYARQAEAYLDCETRELTLP